ncbi:MAG: GNAT family N-acetyltransferase [Gemmatimonadota bacterium]|nr:GNAT family N-acetyltransferase [Gemmatimonadota bacterium]
MTGATQAFHIRQAVPRDYQAILDIYNHYIVHSHVTFDVEPFTLSDRSRWFALFAPIGRHRMFVADAGSIVGYACSTPFRPKEAYATSVETTVYVDPAHTGKGIGRCVYESLLQALEDEDAHRAYAVIALPNPASVRLHEQLGFHRAAVLDQAGRKFGKYWDISWYERSLEPAPGDGLHTTPTGRTP